MRNPFLTKSLIIFTGLCLIITGFNFSAYQVEGAPGEVSRNNGKTNLIFLVGQPAPLVEGYYSLEEDGYDFNLQIFNPKYFDDREVVKQFVEELKKANILLIDMVGSQTAQLLTPLLEKAPAGITMLVTRSGTAFTDSLEVDIQEEEKAAEYFRQGGAENMRRLLLYLLSCYGQWKEAVVLDPVIVKGSFARHPEAEKSFVNREDYLQWYKEKGKLKGEAPWIGIITHNSFYKDADMAMHYQLVEELEELGANVLLVFSDSNRKGALEKFFMVEGEGVIDCLIAATAFNLVFGRPEEGVEILQKLDVPVLTPVYSRKLKDWHDNPMGISHDLHWQVALPELEGRIEPAMLGGAQIMEVDPKTSALLEQLVPLPDRIERVAGRAFNWARLRHEENENKKLALIYYNYGGGKDGITASYLNVIQSAFHILENLQAEGYKVDMELKKAEELLEKMLTVGRNVGSWAPGEIEALIEAGAMTVEVKDYLRWFNKLPSELQKQVNEEWGEAPGEVMVHNGRIILPGMIMGNIFVGPQPMRGWGDDPEKITHSPVLPPTHQYLAFYFWLQEEFGADAVIHLGTHGTLEWLPWRSIGLGEDDWPDVLIGNMPNLNPYIINNPGEGTQAKRRGYAVLIGHLTPPMIRPVLYGELAALQELIIQYELEEAQAGREERLMIMKREIIAKIKETNIHQALGLDLLSDDFHHIIHEVEDYLEEMLLQLMPYGLHTFGRPPIGDLLEEMAQAMVDFDPEARGGSEDLYRENLYLATREMDNLLKALTGRFVDPGLGRDPVRIPEALPTGHNFYSFDPRLAPDRAAWEIGAKAADELLAQYCEINQEYPKRMGVVLWAIETMRTQGETVAMILRLVGAEPRWDKQGRVVGIEVTPLEVLGRPRVDVLVSMSGLFRDTFSYLVEVLDDALKQMALLKEDEKDNYLRKHYQEDLHYYQDKGISAEEAEALALSRIFSEEPGAYGTGVAQMVETTTAWQNASHLAQTFISRMSHRYGRDTYGEKSEIAFRRILETVEGAVQVRDSLYGMLDNDDVYQYLGGLSLAARHVSGKENHVFIANTRNPQNLRVQTVERFLNTEINTRILNPVWIEGMLKEGYSGSTTISKHLAHLFGVDATMDIVDDWSWNKVMETYIFDENIKGRLTPEAAQSIAGWGLEAARRDMWEPGEKMLAALADAYIENVAEYGVVCCHHTCANLVFNEWLAVYSSVSREKLQKFREMYEKATGKNLEIPQRGSINIKIISDSDSQPAAAIYKEEQKEDVYKETPEPEPAEAGEYLDPVQTEPEVDKRRGYELHAQEEIEGKMTGVTFWAILGALALAAVVTGSYFWYTRKLAKER